MGCIISAPMLGTLSPLFQNMTLLHVRHTTIYRYHRPVRLGDHRLMLRPRDSHDLRLIRTSLNLSPPASLRWVHDVFGNSIAIASFAVPTTELRGGTTHVPDRRACGELSIHLFGR